MNGRIYKFHFSMSEPTVTEPDDDVIAVHEAGHLIVGRFVGRRALKVSIDWIAGNRGCFWDKDTKSGWDEFSEMRCLLARPRAQVNLRPDSVAAGEAEPLMKRALSIDEKSYGPEHPRVATDLNNLALLFHATNRLAEAEPLMRRTLSIDEKGYGAEHPTVANSLNNLARLLQDTNRLAAGHSQELRSTGIDS